MPWLEPWSSAQGAGRREASSTLYAHVVLGEQPRASYGRWALLAVAVLGLALWFAKRRRPDAPPVSLSAQAAPKPVEPRLGPRGAPAAGPTRNAPARATCEAGAAQLCYRGDVWSLDGCNNLEGKIDECGARECKDGACAMVTSIPCREPEQGRCEGDQVKLCYAGRPRTIDCASLGLACVMGDEGAECAPSIAPAERCSGPTRCEGTRLIRCEEGRKLELDCETERATCLTLPKGGAPQCVRLSAGSDHSKSECGPCGCPQTGETDELRCDGQDDDGDRLIDEGLDCGPMPVVAFIVTDADGSTSHAPEDVDAELELVNEILRQQAGDTPALSFVLDELVWLPEPTLLEIDDREVNLLADDPRVHPARDEAYLPLIFTDSIVGGGNVPKAGVSTLPNGSCGGMQERPGPTFGIVAVSKGRSETTVAHEIGHFLGLCHTHEQRSGPAALAVSDASGLASCQVSCSLEGDGVCDTPPDPGPELCMYDAACETGCRGGQSPDASNLMSYYTACRTQFSPEQLRLMQHSLAMRRSWYPCSVEPCPCKLGEDTCPEGMSCRPHQTREGPAYLCSLDGPRAAGADCKRASDCGEGSVCLTDTNSGLRRCARTCTEPTQDCDCVTADDALRVCRQDMTP